MSKFVKDKINKHNNKDKNGDNTVVIKSLLTK